MIASRQFCSIWSISWRLSWRWARGIPGDNWASPAVKIDTMMSAATLPKRTERGILIADIIVERMVDRKRGRGQMHLVGIFIFSWDKAISSLRRLNWAAPKRRGL